MAGTGRATQVRHLVLCDSCGEQFEAWLAGLPTHEDGPGKALDNTVIASMSLT
jgi:hypothetical protein